MQILSAIQLVLTKFPSAIFVSTCGYITRDLYNLKDQENNFYVLGSMGMAAPIALGLSTIISERQIVILDGDGSFLMNLGVIAMIASMRPRNLIHVILDNGMHESTGGQATVHIDNIAEVARAVGYRITLQITNQDQIALDDLFLEGPILLHFQVEPRSKLAGKRVELTPQQIVKRFTENVRKD